MFVGLLEKFIIWIDGKVRGVEFGWYFVGFWYYDLFDYFFYWLVIFYELDGEVVE